MKGSIMKKYILALQVLLFLLIALCVYQKTYAIYAKNNNTNNTSLNTGIATPSNLKEHKTETMMQKKDISTVKSTPVENIVISTAKATPPIRNSHSITCSNTNSKKSYKNT